MGPAECLGNWHGFMYYFRHSICMLEFLTGLELNGPDLLLHVQYYETLTLLTLTLFFILHVMRNQALFCSSPV